MPIPRNKHGLIAYVCYGQGREKSCTGAFAKYPNDIQGLFHFLVTSRKLRTNLNVLVNVNIYVHVQEHAHVKAAPY